MKKVKEEKDRYTRRGERREGCIRREREKKTGRLKGSEEWKEGERGGNARSKVAHLKSSSSWLFIDD